MSIQRRYLLAAVTLSAVVVVWAGYSPAKRAHDPNEPLTHAEIAGPAAVKANADQLPGTIVTPHLEYEITSGKNVLWCATFQIAWNELCDLLGGPIQGNGAPEMVNILNKRAVTRRDLDETSYVALAGKTTRGPDDIRQKITRELDRKFKGAASPELLSQLDSVSPGLWVTYAYLFKDLPFEWAFTRMDGGLTFADQKVENFGIRQFLEAQENEARAASQAFVYDYRSHDDFIVELQTRSTSDRLILAKVPPKQTLAGTVASVWTRMQRSKPGRMQILTDLLVPVLDFDVLRSYTDLIGKNSSMGLLVQQIRFRLDERGVILKSEGGGVSARMPQNLVFDKPFLVMIRRTGAKQPYFVLWVGNAELLVPFQPRR